VASSIVRKVYSHQELARVIAPRSVAVVGASPTTGSFGANAAANLQAFEGTVYLVNPRYQEIAGAKCYPDIASLPETPDCVALVTPRDACEPVLRQCAERGVGGVVMFASGYAETGNPEFAHAQERVARIAGETGLRIIGPNCVGVMNYAQGLVVSFTTGAHTERPSTPAIGLASQSGAMGNAVVQAARMGIPFSHMLTAGNSCDVDTADNVSYLADDPACSVIVCIFEGLRSPLRLLQAAKRAAQNEKPLIICKIATSEKGAASAMSHTGALAGAAEGWKAMFSRMGAVVVDNLEDVVETAAFFLKARNAPKRGAALLAASGGFCVTGVDKAEFHDVSLPAPSPVTLERLRSLIPSFGVAANPCDMTAQNTPETIRACCEALLDDENFDVLVMPYTYAWERGISRITDLDEVAAQKGKVACLPWTTAWTTGPGSLEAQQCTNVAVFRSMDSCFRTLGAWGRREAWLREQSASTDSARRSPAGACAAVRSLLAEPDGSALTEAAAKDVLREYGVPVVEEAVVADVGRAVEAAAELGFPVAMKIVSPDILHKTEVGVVKLNIQSSEQVADAFEELMAKARALEPTPRIEGLLVQPMVPRGIELMIGGRVDPLFGPLVLVGMGGIMVELLRDSAVELAPISLKQANGMLESLKGYPLLKGFRGAEGAELQGVAEVICRVSEFLHDYGDQVAEIDVNPLICLSDRSVAVDALIVKRGVAAQSHD
jgi:acyl-CoA synthetase (NDP forming)